MKYLLPVFLVTGTPAIAHSGAYLHAHEANPWLGAIILVGSIASVCVLAKIRMRVTRK